MKVIKFLSLLLILIVSVALLATPVLADCFSDCIANGNTPGECRAACAGGAGAGDLGSVTNPLPYSGTGPGGGLIILFNNVLRLVFVGAGIYAFIRLIVAGLGFISAGGDSKKMTSAWNSIWQSLLGLIIIIGSFAIAALIGQLLYRDPGAILSPKIYGPN